MCGTLDDDEELRYYNGLRSLGISDEEIEVAQKQLIGVGMTLAFALKMGYYQITKDEENGKED